MYVYVHIYIGATVILANNIFHFGFGFCPGRNAAVARYHFFPPLFLSLCCIPVSFLAPRFVLTFFLFFGIIFSIINVAYHAF